MQSGVSPRGDPRPARADASAANATADLGSFRSGTTYASSAAAAASLLRSPFCGRRCE
jgi:hypothetical protein